jgi:hypothetical protein
VYNPLCFEIAYDLQVYGYRSNYRWFEERKSDQAARPISIGPLNGLLHLYAQPIDLVVFQGSLVSCDRETVSWEELGT